MKTGFPASTSESDQLARSDDNPLVFRKSHIVSTSQTGSNLESPVSVFEVFAESANATAAVEDYLAANVAVRMAFANAQRDSANDDELLERLSIELETLFSKYGHVAFDVARRIILIEGVQARVGLYALRAAGHVGAENVSETRRGLATDAIQSKVPEIRFGALHVFADLEDPAAVPTLSHAAEREPVSAIRADIHRLIELLKRQA